MSNNLEKKKKLKSPRNEIPEQDPTLRSKNFNEVNLGYTVSIAKKEAERCLQCAKPLCIEGCPVEVDIPAFIKLIQEEKFCEAAWKIKEKNALPGICGRICPQENQCEGNCVLGKKFEPVAIGHLERFVADYEREESNFQIPEKKKRNGKKVAIIGSGPAGLTVAGDLIKLGYDITIFEAFHKGGGVLAYGIPEFRLPKKIVQEEINYLIKQGVKINYNMVIGKVLTFDDLLDMGFEAIFIGIGAGLPQFLGIPGENLNRVVTANEYLTRVNLMNAYNFPDYKTPFISGNNVIVIGGGNVAMDSARTALRLGADKVTIVYRRAMEQLPARKEEVHHARDEGIIFNLLTNPTKFIGNEEGNIEKVEVIKMRLGEPDSSGRAQPVPIKDSEFFIDADLVIIAIGTTANPLLTSTYKKLQLTERGYIATDKFGRTNITHIFAGGDIVTGGSTAISAMGAGRGAAKAIHQYLQEL